MIPKDSKIKIYFDKDIVTTNEIFEIIKIVNVSIGLASLDLLKEINEDKYQTLKYSFLGFINSKYSRSRSSINENYKVIANRRNILNKNIESVIHGLKTEYSNTKSEVLNYSIVNLIQSIQNENIILDDFLKFNLEISYYFKGDDFDDRNFNLNDFNEWLNIDTSNNISIFTKVTTENSLYSDIQPLVLWGLENYDLVKDITILTYSYISSFIKSKKENSITNSIPELPKNTISLLKNYDEVELNYKKGDEELYLKLKKRNKK